jgi:hypothetical protein
MSGRGTIPYTHWAYFEDRDDADECATELNGLGLLVRVDANSYKGADRSGEWLLRASWDVPIDDLIETHDRIEAIVVWHGGVYDGGESGWLDADTGKPHYGSAADEWFAESDPMSERHNPDDTATSAATPVGVSITEGRRPDGRLRGWVRAVVAQARRAAGHGS